MNTNLFRIFSFYSLCIITTRAGTVFYSQKKIPIKFRSQCSTEICEFTKNVCHKLNCKEVQCNAFKTFFFYCAQHYLQHQKSVVFYKNWACAYQKIVECSLHAYHCGTTNVSTIISFA